MKKWSWKSEVHVKKVLYKGYLWQEAKTFPGEKRKHYQPTYNGKFSVGMHKHSKRWRSTLPTKKNRDYKVSKILTMLIGKKAIVERRTRKLDRTLAQRRHVPILGKKRVG